MNIISKLARDASTAKQAGAKSEALKGIAKFFGKKVAPAAATWAGGSALHDYGTGATANAPGGLDWQKQRLTGKGTMGEQANAILNPMQWGSSINAALQGNSDKAKSFALNPGYNLEGKDIKGSPYTGGDPVSATVGSEGVSWSPAAQKSIAGMNELYGDQGRTRQQHQNRFERQMLQSNQDITGTQGRMGDAEQGMGLSEQGRSAPEAPFQQSRREAVDPLNQRISALEEELKMSKMSPEEQQNYQLQKKLQEFNTDEPMTQDQWQQYTGLQQQLKELQAGKRSVGGGTPADDTSGPGSLPDAQPYQGAYRVGNDTIIFRHNPRTGRSEPVRIPNKSIPRSSYMNQSP